MERIKEPLNQGSSDVQIDPVPTPSRNVSSEIIASLAVSPIGATQPSIPPSSFPDALNTETHEPPITQHQGQISPSSWFNVVSKVVSKADKAVLNFADRLPSISGSNRREGSATNELSLQGCQSCIPRNPSDVIDFFEPDSLLQACIRRQCKCKCHHSPSSSLVQARRAHGAVQRNANRKNLPERKSITHARENTGPNISETRPIGRNSLLMSHSSVENSPAHINFERLDEIRTQSSRWSPTQGVPAAQSNVPENTPPPSLNLRSGKKKNKKS